MPNGLTKNSEATPVEMLPGIFRRTLNEGVHTMLCELRMAAGTVIPGHTHPHTSRSATWLAAVSASAWGTRGWS